MSRINRILRYPINRRMRKRLKNKDFSLFCNNCTGAFVLHDLGVRFNSPCVNLYMSERDYLKLIKNLQHYKDCKLVFIESNMGFPVAKLDDITINFMHYETEQQAEEQWYKRFSRVNFNNMFFILHQREECTDEIIKEFDELEYDNKISFTCRPYNEYKSNFYIPNREVNGYLDHIYPFKSPYTGKKYYDEFDFVAWFNNQRI